MHFPSLLLFAATILLSSSGDEAKAPSRKACRALHTGKFAFRPEGGKAGVSYRIDRNDSVQIETDEQTGGVATLAIKWIDDCTYELLLLRTTQQFPESLQQLRRTVPLTTQILTTSSRYYVFRMQRRDIDLVLTDTMWVRP